MYFLMRSEPLWWPLRLNTNWLHLPPFFFHWRPDNELVEHQGLNIADVELLELPGTPEFIILPPIFTGRLLGFECLPAVSRADLRTISQGGAGGCTGEEGGLSTADGPGAGVSMTGTATGASGRDFGGSTGCTSMYSSPWSSSSTSPEPLMLSGGETVLSHGICFNKERCTWHTCSVPFERLHRSQSWHQRWIACPMPGQ